MRRTLLAGGVAAAALLATGGAAWAEHYQAPPGPPPASSVYNGFSGKKYDLLRLTVDETGQAMDASVLVRCRKGSARVPLTDIALQTTETGATWGSEASGTVTLKKGGRRRRVRLTFKTSGSFINVAVARGEVKATGRGCRSTLEVEALRENYDR